MYDNCGIEVKSEKPFCLVVVFAVCNVANEKGFASGRT